MNMRKGKYLKPKAKKKKPVILILSLVLLLAVAVGGTVAYLRATSGSVTNTFTPAEVAIHPTESVDTTNNTKSNIKFQNTGNVPVYIRATLAVYWKDSEGNFVAPPAGSSVKVGDVDIQNAQPLSNWTKVGDIYYYNLEVAPNGWTDVLLDTITATVPDGYTCHIDVHAEAIQTDGMSATSAQDAWAKTAKSGNS